MAKYWKIGSTGHELAYYVYAPSRDAALREVDFVLGGHNPAKILVRAITYDEVPEDAGVFGLAADRCE